MRSAAGISFDKRQRRQSHLSAPRRAPLGFHALLECGSNRILDPVRFVCYTMYQVQATVVRCWHRMMAACTLLRCCISRASKEADAPPIKRDYQSWAFEQGSLANLDLNGIHWHVLNASVNKDDTMNTTSYRALSCHMRWLLRTFTLPLGFKWAGPYKVHWQVQTGVQSTLA
jgi:hypothetical protein